MVELRKDPLISFIVPVYKVPSAVLKRCIMSLVEQDYPNIEIVVVFDGIDQDLIQVVTPFLPDNKNLRVIEISHAGACAARNAGFNASNGEIISFFNSDYIANPGMAKLWVDSLLDNPDCGFAYGSYEYNTTPRSVYWAKPFDPFQLEQANYIDCGFPIWRQHVVEWDAAIKSLQDWDFWLRVVKKGVKGFYIQRDISFVAELPRAGGLSMDSHNNWVERVKTIKTKNKISQSPLVVTSVGAQYHGSEIAKLLHADYRDDTILKPNDYSAVYVIGFFMHPQQSNNMHPDILASFNKKIKIVHFVGADIYWLRKFKSDEVDIISTILNENCEHILCETELAQSELAHLGVKAQIVPIPPYGEFDVKPLPEKFSVGIFLTDKSDFDKYCQKETLSIVRALPNVQFNAYGDGALDVRYPNLKHHGNIWGENWQKFVYDNSCYFRIVRHDTRPMASDQFLLAGRDVITNIPGQFVEYINTREKHQFDAFQVGLNDFNWPKIKKEIVHKILDVKKNPKADELRWLAHNNLSVLLDKDAYREKIYEMAKCPNPFKELSVVGGK